MRKQPNVMEIEILLQLKTTRNIELTDRNLIKGMEGYLYIITVSMEENWEKINDIRSDMNTDNIVYWQKNKFIYTC